MYTSTVPQVTSGQDVSTPSTEFFPVKKVYGATHAYMIDDYDPIHDIPGREPDMDSIHLQKNKKIRTMFEEITNCVIHRVRLPKLSRDAAWNKYWDAELQTKSARDHIIIYFHGGAGYQGQEYEWKFSGSPKSINAYDFIMKLNESKADVMMLLDCYIPSRFFDKWTRKHAMTEILARGGPSQCPDGTLTEEVESDFTVRLVRNMKALVRNIKTYNRRAPLSIAQLMANDRGLSANPIRIWINRPENGSEQIIRRFRMDPQAIRVLQDYSGAKTEWKETKRHLIEFFAYQIQGPTMESSKGAAIEESLFVDEAIGDEVSDETARLASGEPTSETSTGDEDSNLQ